MSAIVRNIGEQMTASATATSIIVDTLPTKIDYKVGEILDLSGMIVSIQYDDGSSEQISNYTTHPDNGATLTKLDDVVSVSWVSDDGITEAVSFDINVKYVKGISVVDTPTKTSYVAGETFSSSGLTVYKNYSDGTSEQITDYSLSDIVDGTIVSKNTDTTVDVSYTDEYDETFSTSFNISVKYVTGITITTNPTKTSYTAGDSLSLSGMVVKKNYSDNTSEEITDYTTSPAKGATLTKSDSTVTVSYTTNSETFTTSYSITVKYVTGITVSTKPTTTSYYAGDTLDLTGMVVKKKYSDGTTSTITGYTTSPSEYSTLIKSDTSVTVKYTTDGSTFTTSFSITVAYVTGIKVYTKPTTTTYTAGAKLSTSGMVIHKVYSDNTSVKITNWTTSPTNGSTLSTSNTKITITATVDSTSYTCTQSITVKAAIAYWATSTYSAISTFLSSVDNGDYSISSYWSVGDERTITLSDDDSTELTFVVEDLNGSTSGGTKYHAIIGQKEIYDDLTKFASSTVTGYNNSDIKTYLNDTYYTYLPSTFKNIIKSSSHIAGTTSGSTQTVSSVKFVLRSEKEVIGECTYSVSTEASKCKQFTYYATTSNRIKYWDSNSTNNRIRTHEYWTRSCCTASSTPGVCIASDGDSWACNQGKNEGVSPFCCI